MRGTNIEGLDLSTLEVLHVLLEERSVSRTAARLGLSQPGVSHALGRLREALGDPLFVRSKNALVPTVRAEALGRELPPILASLTATLEKTPRAFDPAAASRTFTIASADYASMVLLPRLARVLETEAPGIQVRVRVADYEEATPLLDGSLDLMIVRDEQASTSMRRQRLLHERFVSVVRRGHPVLREEVTLERWLTLKHVVIAPRASPGSIVDDALARLGFARTIAMTVPHFLVAPFIVQGSDLVVTLAARIAEELAEPLGLHVFETPIPTAGFTLASVWHERHDRDPAHAWLRRTLLRVAKMARDAQRVGARPTRPERTTQGRSRSRR